MINSNPTNFIVGSLGIVGLIVTLVLAALWVIFPFMVYSKFNQLIKLQERTAELLELIHAKDSKSPRPSPVRYDLEESQKMNAGAVVGALAAVVVIGVVIFAITRK